jgi:hypothetical protein
MTYLTGTAPNWSDEQYNDTERKPRVQALRGSDTASCGFFIPEKNLAACDWIGKQAIAPYTYEKGEVSTGILLQSFAMIAVPLEGLKAIDKMASEATKTTITVPYDIKLHQNRDLWGCSKDYDVMFLTDELEPLHSIALQMTVKGSTLYSFSSLWQETCTAIAKQITGKAVQKTNAFNKLCVFRGDCLRTLAGDKKASSHALAFAAKPIGKDAHANFLGTDEKYTIANQYLTLPPTVLSAELVSSSDEELVELKAYLGGMAGSLNWSPAERAKWAIALHGCPVASWSIEMWRSAVEEMIKLVG